MELFFSFPRIPQVDLHDLELQIKVKYAVDIYQLEEKGY